MDPTNSILAGLSPRAQEVAFWLVWAARTAGYPVIVTSGIRSLSAQQSLLRRGLTKTLDSAHLRGDAFDIDWFRTDRDDIPASFWQLIGPWAETNLPVRWGGRFRSLWDPGHFEVR